MKEYLDLISNYISNHQHYSYIILFIGATLDTLFPIGFFIYWEIFFLAWSMLAWLWILNIFYVSIVLYIWWVLWDSISFYLWYKYWDNFLNWLFNSKLFIRLFKKYWKDELLKTLEEKWWITIFLTRVWWPIARLTPFAIWSIKYKYTKFLKYNIPWVIFWISIFISVWYFFWTNYQNILNYIYNYIFLFLLIIISWIITYTYLVKFLKLHKYINIKQLKFMLKKKFLRKFIKHIIIFTSILLIIYSIFLYFLYFHWPVTYKNHFFYFENNITNIDTIKNINLNTYFNWNKNKIVQPINFIIITKQDITKIFNNLWRQENKIILKDQITIKDYLKLYWEKNLPITNLIFMWKNQDFWYQMWSDSNKKRIHLRWWNYWKYWESFVYLITISKDNEYEIDLYDNFITPIHEIDKNIDNSRDFLYNQIKSKYWNNIKIKKIETKKINNKIYNTDWIIYVITI